MKKYLAGSLFGVILFLMVSVSAVLASPTIQMGSALKPNYTQYSHSTSSISYSGSWLQNNNLFRYTTAIGDSLTFPIRAEDTGFQLYIDRQSDGRSADVYIDNVLIGEVSSYVAGTHNDVYYYISGYPSGSHTVKLVVKSGTGNYGFYFIGYAVGVADPTLPSIPVDLLATAGNTQVTLTWPAVTGATGYNIKRSTTAGGPYTPVATNVYGSPYIDTTVTNGIKYYYVVTAVNAGGESGNSNEASATPTAPAATNRALLVITLVSGLEKEYDLSMTEVNSFTTWYAARAAGTGPEVYTINKSFNKASFLTRKDNIAFNKIELYEVNEYTPAP
ncbi:fibronectin type III domain-containing protein [Paenibacillus periandrae]|uniref:fibronectin type III domain-containing protein n=1 Tax=Paenibacillus periandrae TaxID=1761741 RepID=UPI001F0A019A|nr:fibronectin type III domain-containing protein [Paenibacillus periandrae]